MNEEEAERQRGIRFFVTYFVAFAAGAAAAGIFGNWLAGCLVTSVLFLSGYRWTRSPRAERRLREREDEPDAGCGAGRSPAAADS